MKATGIIRRIDDLGRIVIPREIRRNLGIIEGDPLEIFYTEEENGLYLSKYCRYPAQTEIDKLKRIARDELDSESEEEVSDLLDRLEAIFND